MTDEQKYITATKELVAVNKCIKILEAAGFSEHRAIIKQLEHQVSILHREITKFVER